MPQKVNKKNKINEKFEVLTQYLKKSPLLLSRKLVYKDSRPEDKRP